MEERNALVDPDRLERLLVRAGAEGRTVTYGEVLRHFGRRVGPGNVARLCRDLGEVCRRVEARGGPDLSCLVVRRDDGMPGEGWFPAGQAFAVRSRADDAAARALVHAAQARAFAWCREQFVGEERLPPEIDFLG